MSQIGIEKDIRIIRLEEAGVYLTPDEIVSKIVEESNAPEMEVADITEGENEKEDN